MYFSYLIEWIVHRHALDYYLRHAFWDEEDFLPSIFALSYVNCGEYSLGKSFRTIPQIIGQLLYFIDMHPTLWNQTFQDSWEPIDNIVGCESLIATFRKSSEDAEVADTSIRAKRKAERAAEQEAEAAADDDSEWKDGAKVKRKAACWRCFICKFSEFQPEKIESVYCKICGPDFTVEYSGNTSNMRNHLAHVHKDVFCKMVSSAEGNGVGGGDGGGPGTCSGSCSSTSDSQQRVDVSMLPPVPNDRRDALHKLIGPHLYV
ncbi:hypothetical protein CYMTET_14933 [Cymbomonas tetramitiformis]|uniref:BED-type domain-containing protein n=1 Tax=Cymbomonas tetramitiformis TaxID=36881 RepID=A0AAE0GFL1_9CHLO|nr:hypothetical protein CYMTET_14933 [Cymbomonas tetramitiformis]